MSLLASRLPRLTLVGISTLVALIVVYDHAQGLMIYTTPGKVALYESLAYIYFVFLSAALFLILLGLWKLLEERKKMTSALGAIRISLGSLIPHIFLQKKYFRSFLASTLLYALFYSFITSMVVYQPSISFSETYLAKVPSALIIPSYGLPGQVPILVGYLTEHIGLLIVPANVILLVAVSILVGLNSSLAYFAYENRPRGASARWLGGMGATIGLFTGCPTCAGLFLANMVGGAGTAVGTAALASLQPLFIGISVPALLATSFLTSNTIARAYAKGCILVAPGDK